MYRSLETVFRKIKHQGQELEMAAVSAEMDSLFEGMDFVMPLEDNSVLLGVGGPKNSQTEALEAQEATQESSKSPASMSQPPLSAASLDPVSPSSGRDLGRSFRSSVSVLPSPTLTRNLSESFSPTPASPSSHGALHRDPSAPLDESLFSGLTMSSLDDETTAESFPGEAFETNETTGTSVAETATKTFVGAIQNERSRSFDDPAGGERIGNGGKDGGSTESVMAVSSDASPYLSSVKHASSGTPPPISKTDSGSPLTPSPSVKPSMRRKKRSMKIGYGREEEESEDLASRKAGIREAIGAALLGKDALNASSISIAGYGLSRESSQGAILVEDSTLGSNVIGDSAHLNGVELVIETSSQVSESQYSTLEVHGIERVASREIIVHGVETLASKEILDEVAGQLPGDKTDVIPSQSNITESDEQDLPTNDKSHVSIVDETRLDIEVAAETHCEGLESTVPSIETEPPVHVEDERGISGTTQDKEDELDMESLIQQRERPIEERLELVQEAVACKLNKLHGKLSVASALRKVAVQKRRQAAETVAIASTQCKELEAELDAACEREDFEKADNLSGSIADAEANMAQAGDAFSVAEAESDSAAAKMQEVFDLQAAIEEEGAKVLLLLKQEAEDSAKQIVKDAQEKASQETERLVAEEKTAELKQKELDLELNGIEKANVEISKAINELTKAESEEKSELTEKQNQLGVELQDLIALVRRKEAEIADFDERILAVDNKVSSVAATFEKQKTGLDTKMEILTATALQLEKDHDLISKGKQEIEQLLADAEKERLSLGKVVRLACDKGTAMQDAAEMKKAVTLAVMQSREKRIELAEKEKQAQAEAQLLRQNAASTRVLLQELTSLKVRLSQELGAVKDRIIFVEKRGPELDTEKKLAAAARNFKVAGRLAAEAKVLNAEKEAASADMERIMKELEKVDGEAEVKLTDMADLDSLVTAKEREGAMAHCERLRLMAAAAMDERDAALALDDFEEAEKLNSEAKAADVEAAGLQRLYQLEGRQYDSQSNSKVIGDAESKDKEAAVAACERLGLEAASARDERAAVDELDPFEEADAQADKLQRIYQLEGKEYSTTVREDVDLTNKVAAMANCERFRLVAAAARDERDTAVELDEFEEAEIFDSKAEAADAQADRLQRLFQLEGSQYEVQISGKARKDTV